MTLPQLGASARHQPPHPIASTGGPKTAKRRLKWAITALVLSACAFVAIVVQQRDNHVKDQAMQATRPVLAALQDYVSRRSNLPAALPEECSKAAKGASIPYPLPDKLSHLRDVKEPFVLFAGPRVGLIAPYGDGCAAIFCKDGALELRWLRETAIQEQRRRRDGLSSP